MASALNGIKDGMQVVKLCQLLYNSSRATACLCQTSHEQQTLQGQARITTFVEHDVILSSGKKTLAAVSKRLIACSAQEPVLGMQCRQAQCRVLNAASCAGILYRDGMQRTVPLAQMEEDLAFKRSVWRRSKKLRNRLHAMKMIIYHVIKQAAQQSRPISEVVRDLDSQLENQIEEVRTIQPLETPFHT